MNFLLYPNKKFKPGEDWIYYTKSVYGQEEIQAVVKALNEDWLGNGKYTVEFEKKVAEIFGKKYGLFVNSGSAANLLAFELLNFPKGSEVITPAMTFGTTIAPIIQKNLTPVLVDSQLGSYNIDLDKVEAAITPKTVAIMMPQIMGNINDMVRIREICDRHKLKLIEDSCDSIGGKFAGKPSGHWADITTTSFYASHNITAGGGGGMIMCNGQKMITRAKVLRDWGRALPEHYEHYEGAFEERYNFKLDNIDYDGKFAFLEVGYNMKAVEMQAAFALVQLSRLEAFNKTRKENFEKIYNFFKQYEKFFILPEVLPEAKVYWLSFPVTIRESSGIERKEMLRFLESNHIQTRVLFAGNILRHPAYKDNKYSIRVSGELTGADTVMKNTFLVAAHHGLNDDMIDYLSGKIREFLIQEGLISS
ncbi:MAG: NarL family transcriptional regulator [Candidatus Portnoybacteria bacterium CG10_big_fil_rev_8_21_14_0_10_44_7]|uniref:NarL family transcriptional regulator n=1 Tax=Candidatus Portnoybacteria bacterium CG10_big_fil_rev_8_21_14_0_10_44_7 TaxID=1974816 RepID=A0A2M8KJF5_9BACT|nr:MAG: NarL family transcriptional regulator [Candidatus Portnoybacteria bacterium CG10_big_fil_rev_8_21_14_0_10_44_7]